MLREFLGIISGAWTLEIIKDWNPYAGMQDLNHGDRPGSDAELEVKHLTSIQR
jgi:hypothetical protein